MEQVVLHPAITVRCNRFADDPVTVIELGEQEFTLLVTGDSFHNLIGDSVQKTELHTGEELARGIDLDELDTLLVVDYRRHGRTGAAEVGVHLQGDLFFAGQITIRGFQLTDGITAVGNLVETHLTIGVGCCHGKAITKGVNQGKLSTREGLAVLIDLLDQHFIGNIDDHSQRFFRIEEGSIHIDLHIHLGREITSQRAGFHDTIAAVRNLFKGCDTAAVGSDGHQRGTVRANQAELHPRKRSLVLIALGNGEAGVVIPNGCGSSHNAIAIHSKGHDGIIQGITIRSVDLTEGIATGRHRNAGKPAVFIGGVTVDHFTLVVVYLDHSTRQGLFTGDVGLGEGYSAMYQIVVNGVNQNHTQHVLIRCLSVGGDG